jgi:hypothetical protein
MNRLIKIEPHTKTKRFIQKNDDRTCEVEIRHEGIFEGFIEKLTTRGVYEIRLLRKIEDR